MSEKDDIEDTKNGWGHICFECRRVIEKDEMITMIRLGPLPIYHHSSCIFGEDKTQYILKNAMIKNKSIHQEEL